jgi:NAD(P)-dependent dehydrogenase (short-subunit alcohol dehydrogenase family)
MARVLVTGSTSGLGAAAARELLDEGHEVVLHARAHGRLSEVTDIATRAVGVVTGDLAERTAVRRVADEANSLGGIDAVIHNAAIYVDRDRVTTSDGHARTLAVNVLAPYLLTAWIEGPDRLVYMSSDMHRRGDASLQDLDWLARRWDGVQAYCDSKLFITTLAFALDRAGQITAHAVDPGWVPTRMGGPGAPDDLELGHRTQAWLAVTHQPEAREGNYWHHQGPLRPAPAARDRRFQDELLEALAALTGEQLSAIEPQIGRTGHS